MNRFLLACGAAALLPCMDDFVVFPTQNTAAFAQTTLDVPEIGAPSDTQSDPAKTIARIVRENPELLRAVTPNESELRQLALIVGSADRLLQTETAMPLRFWAADQKVKALLALYRNKLPEEYERLKDLERALDILENSEGKNDIATARAGRFFLYRFELQFLGKRKNQDRPGPDPRRLKGAIKAFAASLPPREADALYGHLVEVSKQFASTDRQFAIETHKEIGEIHLKSHNRNTVDDGRKLIATSRRYALPENLLIFEGKTLDGETISSNDLKGKVVLIEYWASWCAPCAKILPQLRSCYERYKNRGFEIVAVNADDDETLRDRYVKKEKLPWIVTTDTGTLASSGERFSRHYGIHAYPSMLLVDREGKTVLVDTDMSDVNRELAKIFSSR